MSQAGQFEKNLNELESIVRQLEQGDLPLEEALKQFEKGMKLANKCQTTLNQAEQKVSVLSSSSPSTATEQPDPL